MSTLSSGAEGAAASSSDRRICAQCAKPTVRWFQPLIGIENFCGRDCCQRFVHERTIRERAEAQARYEAQIAACICPVCGAPQPNGYGTCPCRDREVATAASVLGMSPAEIVANGIVLDEEDCRAAAPAAPRRQRCPGTGRPRSETRGMPGLPWNRWCDDCDRYLDENGGTKLPIHYVTVAASPVAAPPAIAGANRAAELAADAEMDQLGAAIDAAIAADLERAQCPLPIGSPVHPCAAHGGLYRKH